MHFALDGYWLLSTRELDSILKRIHESDTQKRIHRIDEPRISLRIFRGNFADMKRYIPAVQPTDQGSVPGNYIWGFMPPNTFIS